MKLSANQATKEAGVAKKTLLEAIKEGRMSADKNDKGHWQIDPAELFRVFPRTSSEPVLKTDTHPREKPQETSALEVELKFMREKLADKEAMIDDLRGQRDKWQSQAERLLLERPKPEDAKPEVIIPPVTQEPTNENTPPEGQGLLAKIFGKSKKAG